METNNSRIGNTKNASKMTGKTARYVLTALFAVYFVWVIGILFLFRIKRFDTGLPYLEMIGANHNLVPFKMVGWQIQQALHSKSGDLVRYAAVNAAGNLLLFFPMGIFLPCLFKKLRKLYKTLPLIMGMVVIAELIQLFTLSGFADIDDLIFNTAGAAAGYFIFYIVSASTRE